MWQIQSMGKLKDKYALRDLSHQVSKDDSLPNVFDVASMTFAFEVLRFVESLEHDKYFIATNRDGARRVGRIALLMLRGASETVCFAFG